jgi:hypothetical protein
MALGMLLAPLGLVRNAVGVLRNPRNGRKMTARTIKSQGIHSGYSLRIASRGSLAVIGLGPKKPWFRGGVEEASREVQAPRRRTIAKTGGKTIPRVARFMRTGSRRSSEAA